MIWKAWGKIHIWSHWTIWPWPLGQGQNFIAKCYVLDFRILTVILAVYLLGITSTGEQCWRNARFALQGHCVTFKFRYKIIRHLHKSAFSDRLAQLNMHQPGGATLSDTITINFISLFRHFLVNLYLVIVFLLFSYLLRCVHRILWLNVLRPLYIKHQYAVTIHHL